MKENSIEKLKQQLDELYRTQQARLACGADDLDIREEISEVEAEIKELEYDINEKNNNGNDTNVGSIEKDIINAQHFIDSIKTDKEYKEENGWHGYYNKEIVELARILEHILSDYKRVLEEIESWKSYSEELDEEITEISNKKCELEFEVEKLQKENELAKQALIRNCNIADEKNQLLKENEKLKNNIRKNENELEFDVNCDWITLQKILDESEKSDEYILYKNEKWIKEKYCISFQKVKNKIKELNKKIDESITNSKGGLDEDFIKEAGELLSQKRVLQELIESEDKL